MAEWEDEMTHITTKKWSMSHKINQVNRKRKVLKKRNVGHVNHCDSND